MSHIKRFTFSKTMKQLIKSIRSNNKQSERRDFINESLNLAKPIGNLNTHLEAGFSSHHYSNSDVMAEQDQPFEIEAMGESDANNKTKQPDKDN